MQIRTALITAVLTLVFGLTACGDSEDGSESGAQDFSVTDLETLSFVPDDIPGMEYQPDSSGLGAFSEDQRREAKEEGDKSGLELVDHLEELGLEADSVSQFFATSRDSELFFVESITFLFGDADSAAQAVDVVRDANAENIDPAEEIDPPQLGEQAFGLRGEFDGFPVYSFGWRVGDVIQVASVAPGDEKAGPEGTLELAEQLAAKAEQ